MSRFTGAALNRFEISNEPRANWQVAPARPPIGYWWFSLLFRIRKRDSIAFAYRMYRESQTIRQLIVGQLTRVVENFKRNKSQHRFRAIDNDHTLPLR